MAAIHAGSQRSYGRIRIQRGLSKKGIEAGHERVRKAMQRQGLRSGVSAPLSCDHGLQSPQAGGEQPAESTIPRLADQSGMGIRHHIHCHASGLAGSGLRHGSGQSQNRRLVDERPDPSSAGGRSTQIRRLAAQTGLRPAAAFGPWQLISSDSYRRLIREFGMLETGYLRPRQPFACGPGPPAPPRRNRHNSPTAAFRPRASSLIFDDDSSWCSPPRIRGGALCLRKVT
jgi:hypothetical protein